MRVNQQNCGSTTACDTGAKHEAIFVPPIRLYEGADAFQLVAEVPGADDQSTDVTVEKGVLTVSAKMAPPASDDLKVAYSEFKDGCYRRSFQLSDAVDTQAIEASVTKGVLTVRLPKAKASLPQKVRVIAG